MSATDLILSRLVATLQSSFRILDVVWKRVSATVIEARNSGDTAYIIVRGADPVGNDDLVTKRYLDATGSAGSVEAVQFAVGIAATTDSTTQLTNNTTPLRAKVKVTTAYSAGATMTVGNAASPSFLMAAADIDLTVAGTYEVSLASLVWAGPAAVRATIAGAPAVGASTVEVEYSGSINP